MYFCFYLYFGISIFYRCFVWCSVVFTFYHINEYIRILLSLQEV